MGGTAELNGGKSGRSSRSRVLVVDDEPEVLVALEDVLSDDHEVLKASSPERALSVLERERDVAVVLSDQRMPGMTGDELLSRLRESSDATRVMVTGYAELAAVIRAVNNGNIFAYVTKPWDTNELRMTVNKSVEHFELLRELARERQLLEDLMDNVPDAIYFKDRALRFQHLNRAYAERMALKDVTHALGKRLLELGVPPELAADFEHAESDVIAEGRSVNDLVREVETPAGRRFYSTTLAPIRGLGASVQGLVGISRDVTTRHETERALRRLTRVRTVLGAVNAAIVRVKDRVTLMREACRIAVEDGGLLAAGLFLVEPKDGSVMDGVAHGASSETLWQLATQRLLGSEASSHGPGDPPQPHIVNDLRLVDAGSPVQEVALHGGKSIGVFPLVVDSAVVGSFVLVAPQEQFFDSEEARLLSELADNIVFAFDHLEKGARLDFLAYYDELTGLPKRSLLTDRLNQLLPGRLKGDGALAVLIVDVSRFRQVNDTLGRSGGDELLVQIAARLTEFLGERDTLARFDSNAFAIVLTEPGPEPELATFIEREILTALTPSFVVRDTELRIAVRVGVAMFPSDATDAEGLIRNAEAALANARAKAQPYLFYAPSMNARLAEKLSLEMRLRRALEEEQFLLHYQPKVELKTGALLGLEALIRWKDPERGLISPAEFIPVLEETGLILDVGRWVLDHAAAQYESWVEEGLSPPRIAVNVSALQLAQRRFVRSVEEVLERRPGARGGIDLELTESVLMEDLAGNIDKMRALKALGVCFAIDDFGTGYSSLGYLSRLPIDALKVDRSFVIRMVDDPQDMTIVTTIISLAHSLDLKVIAEGVETADQARLLKLVKCDQIQGYLVGRPQAPMDAATHFGARKRTWPPSDPRAS
jgi:diguanylate cyclase (GGDEF)-like protein/PAS domain S-box-containing protein